MFKLLTSCFHFSRYFKSKIICGVWEWSWMQTNTIIFKSFFFNSSIIPRFFLSVFFILSFLHSFYYVFFFLFPPYSIYLSFHEFHPFLFFTLFHLSFYLVHPFILSFSPILLQVDYFLFLPFFSFIFPLFSNTLFSSLLSLCSLLLFLFLIPFSTLFYC